MQKRDLRNLIQPPKGQALAVIGISGTGKSTVSLSLLPDAVFVTPMGSTLDVKAPSIGVYPTKKRFTLAMRDAYTLMAKRGTRQLVLDDADVLSNIDAALVDDIISLKRNRGLQLIVQAKAPMQISKVARTMIEGVLYNPAEDEGYHEWARSRGLPSDLLPVHHFYFKNGHDAFVINSSLTKYISAARFLASHPTA